METPGVAHTVAIAGMSFLLAGQRSNFGSMFIVLDPFDERQAPELPADDIMARLRKEFRRRVKDAVVAGAQLLADPRPRRRRRLQAHRRGPRRPRAGGPPAADRRPGDDDEARSGPGHRVHRVPLAARRSSTWTSTGPRPRPWACRSTT